MHASFFLVDFIRKVMWAPIVRIKSRGISWLFLCGRRIADSDFDNACISSSWIRKVDHPKKTRLIEHSPFQLNLLFDHVSWCTRS